MLVEVKHFYFEGIDISVETFPILVDIFSDSFMVYQTIKQAEKHVKVSDGNTFLYR